MGLPDGTVTFLFTDIAGSTRLLEELGAQRYAEALAEHRRILRTVFEAHSGVEVDTLPGRRRSAGSTPRGVALGATHVPTWDLRVVAATLPH
jgi:class 3 adenylate cyclase